MPNIACSAKKGYDKISSDFDASYIERVKQAASKPSGGSKNFSIIIEYENEDGHQEIDDDIDVKSWDEIDKIACIVLTYLVEDMGAMEYSTLESVEIKGNGKTMDFNETALTKIARDVKKAINIKRKAEEEKKEYLKLKAKYG